MDLNIKHDKDNQRFVADVENKKCTIEYAKVGENKLDYRRTFVPENLRHEGIGQQLVTEALDFAKEHDLKVKPSCPFVKSVVEENKEEYEEVLV